MAPMSKSQRVVATALCAALYGATGYITSFIQSPWGFGQFRPAAAIVPVIFAVFFGPWVAGAGGALGSQITDTLTPGYFLSGIIAGMPGNFIGFYLYGWLLKGKFSWRRFVLTSAFTLFVANLVTAALVAVFFALFLPGGIDLSIGIALTIGLTAFWFITMLPFALIIDPVLIRIISRSRPDLTPPEVLRATLRDETREVAIVLILSGCIVFAFGLLFLARPEILDPAHTIYPSSFSAITLQLLFGGGGLIMMALGIIFMLVNRLNRKSA